MAKLHSIKGWAGFSLVITFWLGGGTGLGFAAGDGGQPPRVLAVMSYEADNSWSAREREGIEKALPGYEVRYVYLNTKENSAGGRQRAKEALAEFDRFRPEAVIAVDDNAQELFVLPYLKGKRDVPVVFCGVNDDAGKYGYPTGKITGVVEVKHYRETISFAKLLIKDLRSLVVLYKETPSNEVNVAQIRREQGDFQVDILGFLKVGSLAEARMVMEKIRNQVQAVLLLNLSGIVDSRGRPMDADRAIPSLVKLGIPLLSTQDYAIEAGALCGVVQSGEAQGLKAGKMVKQILSGRKPGEIPVERNLNGRRFLNLATAQQLRLPLGPEVLLGSKLVR